MLFGMGLNKNRHGTYEARKKVPRHLEEAVARVLDNGKPKQIWLKRSLATKDFAEAKRRVKAVQIEFDRIVERAQELLAERPLRDTLSDAEIKLIADWHYAEMLHIDDEETREGTGRDEAMRAIAKQLDDAGIEYDMPYRQATAGLTTACRRVIFGSASVTSSGYCRSCRALSPEATSLK
jgi:hypothetical protein